MLPKGGGDSPLHNPDFLRYWGATAVSTLGSHLSGLAFPLLALSIGASKSEVGLLATCEMLALLLARLPAGQLADWADRRWLMFGSDLARLFALGSIPLAAAMHGLTFAQLLFVALIEGLGTAVFGPAASAAIRDVVVDDDQLTGALSKLTTSSSASLMVGPIIGGWMFTINPMLPFTVDAMSYALSAALLWAMKTKNAALPPTSQRDTRFTAGWRWLARQSELLTIVIFGAAVNLAGTAASIALLLSLREQGVSAAGIGVVMTCAGSGGVLGAMLAPRLIRLLSTAGLLLLVGAVWTAGFAVFVSRPAAALTAVVFALMLVFSPAAGILLGRLVLTTAPRDMLGRIRTAIDTGTMGVAAVGPLMAGAVVEAWGVSRVWLVLAVLTGVATLATGRPRRRGLVVRRHSGAPSAVGGGVKQQEESPDAAVRTARGMTIRVKG